MRYLVLPLLSLLLLLRIDCRREFRVRINYSFMGFIKLLLKVLVLLLNLLPSTCLLAPSGTDPTTKHFILFLLVKRNAWQRLGSLSPEEAMQMYIKLVCDLYPSWTAGSAVSRKDGDGHATSSASKGMMGPVFSSLVYEEDSNTQVKLEALHESAREGEIDKLNKYIDSGVSVNLKDSEGRTALHWAVDRGHINIVELLLSKNADVNAKDDEGQTPLHYAAMCDREDVAEFLVKQNADRDVKDNDGKSPCDPCESNSTWMQL